MNRKYFDITRKQISLSDLVFFLSDNCKVKLSPSAISKINKSRKFLTEEIKKGESLIYGVNTGFGSLCDTKIKKNQIDVLQKNLILSHACGVGDLVPNDIVKLMMLLKIRSLSFLAGLKKLQILYLWNGNSVT